VVCASIDFDAAHPKTPNPIVTSEQMADVIAYILSLPSDRDPES
jgi:hypothetical protein